MNNDAFAALVAYAAAAALLFRFRREIREAIENFKNNLPRGGGPPAPMHPSPARDFQKRP